MPLEPEEEPWEDDLPPDFRPPGTANVGATSTGPAQSSFAPGQSTEPQTATDDGDGAEPEEEPEPLPEFDRRWRDAFEGLLFIGKLEGSFKWMGHDFRIRTLLTDEVLEVGLLHKEYVGTLADVKAYQAAIVAACVVSVDGQPPPIPLTDEQTDLTAKFNYVLRHWFPPTLDAVYEEYLKLEYKVNQVIEAMGKALGSERLTRTSTPVSA